MKFHDPSLTLAYRENGPLRLETVAPPRPRAWLATSETNRASKMGATMGLAGTQEAPDSLGI